MSRGRVDCPFCGRALEDRTVPTSRRLPVAGAHPSTYAVCECGGELRWALDDTEVRVLAARVPPQPPVWVGDGEQQ